MNSIFLCNIFLRNNSTEISDSSNVIGRKFCVPSPLGVDVLRNNLKVIRVYARSISTKMIDLKSFRYVFPVHCVGIPMGAPHFTLNTNPSIPITKNSLPQPARRIVPAILNNVSNWGSSPVVTLDESAWMSFDVSASTMGLLGNWRASSATTLTKTGWIRWSDKIVTHFSVLSLIAIPPAVSAARGLSVPNYTKGGAD